MISLTRGSSEAMKTGRKYRSATHFIASIPISKWIWEVTLVPYSVVSIISIWSFNSEFLAYSLFWLAISGLAYNVVATIFFLSKNPNILKFFRAIGMLLGMIWKDRKKRS